MNKEQEVEMANVRKALHGDALKEFDEAVRTGNAARVTEITRRLEKRDSPNTKQMTGEHI